MIVHETLILTVTMSMTQALVKIVTLQKKWIIGKIS